MFCIIMLIFNLHRLRIGVSLLEDYSSFDDLISLID